MQPCEVETVLASAWDPSVWRWAAVFLFAAAVWGAPGSASPGPATSWRPAPVILDVSQAPHASYVNDVLEAWSVGPGEIARALLLDPVSGAGTDKAEDYFEFGMMQSALIFEHFEDNVCVLDLTLATFENNLAAPGPRFPHLGFPRRCEGRSSSHSEMALM